VSKLYFGTGATTIVMDDVIERSVRAVLDNIAPRTTKLLERAATDLAESARKDWPVKTGRSLLALTSGMRVTTTAIESFVMCPVPYVFYIKGRKQKGKGTWVTLVRTPGLKLGKLLARQLSDELLKMAAAGRGTLAFSGRR